jgi:hypothetical protein
VYGGVEGVVVFKGGRVVGNKSTGGMGNNVYVLDRFNRVIVDR